MNLEESVKAYFEQQVDYTKIAKSNVHLYLLRKDGIIVYQHKRNSNIQIEDQALGVLVTGLCHASEALKKLLEDVDKSQENVYRISFDTASKGIFILPVNTLQETYYFAGAFFNELNPGKLKNELKKMSSALEQLLSNLALDENNQEDRQKYLFKNISDDEIDKMFSFAGS